MWMSTAFANRLALISLVITPFLLAQGGTSPQSNAPAANQSGAPSSQTPQTQQEHSQSGAPQQQRRPMIPDTFTNLKVLSPAIKKPELLQVMKGFSMQLGVRCRHCHDVPDDLSSGSFASDSKDEKQSARSMMKMLAQINSDYVSKLPTMPATATCWTCHRGKSQPEEFAPPTMPGAPPSAPASNQPGAPPK